MNSSVDVIIPDGPSSHERHSHLTLFAKINDIPPQQLVTYHTYRVDTDLGCLTDYTSWRSKLYIAQLHVQTSVDWRPDPLTGSTGIQEALRLLRLVGCRSISELDIRHKEPELLSSSPYKICLYPQISFAIGEIKYLIERERFLCSNQHNMNKSDPPTRPQLDGMGALRTAYLFPFEDAVAQLPVLSDVIHHKSAEPYNLVYTMSLAVYHWLINTENRPELRPGGDTKCVDTLVDKLLDPDPFSPSSIAKVDEVLQEIKGSRQRFQLLFLLPMIFYHQHLRLAFLSILMALARRFVLENQPCCAECWTLDGSHPSRDAVRKCFADARCSPILQGEDDLDTAAMDPLIMSSPFLFGTRLATSLMIILQVMA